MTKPNRYWNGIKTQYIDKWQKIQSTGEEEVQHQKRSINNILAAVTVRGRNSPVWTAEVGSSKKGGKYK